MTPARSTAHPEAGPAKRSYVRDTFAAIAPRYDLINRILSFNIDRSWRRRAVDRLEWERAPVGTYLDLCAGTFDLAIELGRRPGFGGRVLAADFVLPMLHRGRQKAPAVPALAADALDLPFARGAFDGCIVGFGVRNLADLDRGLREIGRVLKPGGRVVILDFAIPTAWPLRPLYLYYFRRILPRIGRLISKHTSAYQYLPDSVTLFPEPAALERHLAAAGFAHTGFTRLTGGITALHWGRAR